MEAWRRELRNSIAATLEDLDKEQEELIAEWLLSVAKASDLDKDTRVWRR